MRKRGCWHAGQPRRKVRRRLYRIGMILLAMLLLWGVGWLGRYLLGQTSYFQVTAIQIEGSFRVSKRRLLELGGVDIHTNLISLDLDEVRRRLEGHAWVAEAEVRRDWPTRINIVIKERRPVALISLEDGLHYVDGSGVVFAKLDVKDDYDFPVISGLAKSAWEDPDNLERREIMDLIASASKGNVNLPLQNISEIHAGSDGNLTVFPADRAFPIFFGRGKVRIKYSRLARVLAWLYKKKKFKATKSIIIDYQDDKILVSLDRAV